MTTTIYVVIADRGECSARVVRAVATFEDEREADDFCRLAKEAADAMVEPWDRKDLEPGSDEYHEACRIFSSGTQYDPAAFPDTDYYSHELPFVPKGSSLPEIMKEWAESEGSPPHA